MLEYVFTEKQFEKDFPLHSLSSQRYYCKAIVNKTDNTDQLELCDTLFVKPVLPAGLTSLWVKTENNEEPTCDLIEAPAGGISISITNATKVPGRVWIKAHDEIVYDSGDYKKDESGMTIKIRGNSSAMADKKPFKIKLQKKYDMLSRGEEYADKDWVLLSTGSDLNTFLGLKISSYANFHWVPKMKFCNLVVNDVYRGLYILTEQVERDTKCRINVDKDGYLIEYDAYWWNEPLSFKTSMYSSVLRYTFKYPDPEDITEEQFAYISDYVHLCEQKIQQGEDYENYIDLNSFAEWLIVHDVLGFRDSAGSNLYFTKHDSGNSLLKMATPWDFDGAFNKVEDWSTVHNYAWFWFPYLISNSNSAFVNAYKTAWEYLQPIISLNIWNDVENEIDKETINSSRRMDALRWNSEYQGVEFEIGHKKDWMKRQISFLDKSIKEL